jgi:FMNH2-dependent dimethyl sulfone monooxygenase
MPRNPGILTGNAFKLGIFGSNCSYGLAFVDFPEHWSGNWEDNLAAARLADASGIECFVANARWKGYGGSADINGNSLETLAWACGLLSKTRNLNVFATVHAPLVNPVFAAKQMATIDHIAEGRFGLNLVLGSKEDEFMMFGIPLEEHDRRYDYGQEWWNIVTRIWTSDVAFDVRNEFFNLRGVIGSPHPYGDRIPAMMNAGHSGKGRTFAIENSDLHFDACIRPEDSAPKVAETKARARAHGRDVQEWTAASVVCWPTRREVDDFMAFCIEHAAWEALDARDRVRASPKSAGLESAGYLERLRRADGGRAVVGRGHYIAHGTPDEVANALALLHQAGLDGVAIGFVDYVKELPYFIQEVVPRLERLGLRRPLGLHR